MSVVRKASDGRLNFKCPGCESIHVIAVDDPNHNGAKWSWNGSMEKPTFNPSVLVTYNGDDAGIDGAPPAVCHSFVRDGQIQFLGDCTHKLAGQTVSLPAF